MWRHTTNPACWKTHGSICVSSSCSLWMIKHSTSARIEKLRRLSAEHMLKELRTDLGTSDVRWVGGWLRIVLAPA